ncbi:hypothetical protein [Spiroplasma endosymbiont of Amphibalanus improvisus]|uniref:hypothetical protein n=1 Tax=Spiroplasma endosymbiont of Amphibalanus improvisus TaxID=3066327 RepID=UPI00313AB96C
MKKILSLLSTMSVAVVPVMSVVACGSDDVVDTRYDLVNLTDSININRTITTTDDALETLIFNMINAQNNSVDISELVFDIPENWYDATQGEQFDLTVTAADNSQNIKGSKTIAVEQTSQQVDLGAIDKLSLSKSSNVKIASNNANLFYSGYYPSEYNNSDTGVPLDADQFEKDLTAALQGELSQIDSAYGDAEFNIVVNGDFTNGSTIKGTVTAKTHTDKITGTLSFNTKCYDACHLEKIYSGFAHYEDNELSNFFLLSNVDSSMQPDLDGGYNDPYSPLSAGTIAHHVSTVFSNNNAAIPPEYKSYLSANNLDLSPQYNFNEPDEKGYYTFKDTNTTSGQAVAKFLMNGEDGEELIPLLPTDTDPTTTAQKQWIHAVFTNNSEDGSTIQACTSFQLTVNKEYRDDFIFYDDINNLRPYYTIIFQYYFPSVSIA